MIHVHIPPALNPITWNSFLNRYTFDVGIHYVGEMTKTNPKRIFLDAISDGQIEWHKHDTAYDVVTFGTEAGKMDTYDVVEGLDNWQTLMTRQFPGEHVAINKYFDLLHRAKGINTMLGVFKVRVYVINGLAAYFSSYPEPLINLLFPGASVPDCDVPREDRPDPAVLLGLARRVRHDDPGRGPQADQQQGPADHVLLLLGRPRNPARNHSIFGPRSYAQVLDALMHRY